MWLDGIHMAATFYTQCRVVFGEPRAFDDVARQIWLMDRHAFDPATGLYLSCLGRSQVTSLGQCRNGLFVEFLGRAVGWYVMALLTRSIIFPLTIQPDP